MKLSLALLALCFGSAAALRATPSMALKLPFGGRGPAPKQISVPENERPLTDRLVGACDPFPEGFDPFNFAARAGKAEMVKFREAELKHGRVAMLAVPGFLLSEDFHPFFPDLPKWEFSVTAFQDTLEQPRFQILIYTSLLIIAAIESITIRKGWAPVTGQVGKESSSFGKMNEDWTPGAYFERGPWTSDKLSAEEYEKKQLAELNNGRLAMVSIFLIVLQEIITKVPAEELDTAILVNKGSLVGL